MRRAREPSTDGSPPWQKEDEINPFYLTVLLTYCIFYFPSDGRPFPQMFNLGQHRLSIELLGFVNFQQVSLAMEKLLL